jgi:hypothetical protein
MDDAKESKISESVKLEDFQADKQDRAQRNHLPARLASYSDEELRLLEKKLVRKIDLRSLPILIVLFLLNILDRNAIANARLGGLEKTLRIDDSQYQTAVMVLWGKWSKVVQSLGEG